MNTLLVNTYCWIITHDDPMVKCIILRSPTSRSSWTSFIGKIIRSHHLYDVTLCTARHWEPKCWNLEVAISIHCELVQSLLIKVLIILWYSGYTWYKDVFIINLKWWCYFIFSEFALQLLTNDGATFLHRNT